MEKILLHACCAPCSAPVLEWLAGAGYTPVLFFFNPNIYPAGEYLRRKEELARHAASLGVECVDGDDDHARWLTAVAGLEDAPERGARCARCFETRLGATARLAAARGVGRFTTTLTGSRWKSFEQIAAAGERAAAATPGTSFWARDWKKGGLTERRAALLAEHRFYNQTYCGCEFSRRDRS